MSDISRGTQILYLRSRKAPQGLLVRLYDKLHKKSETTDKVYWEESQTNRTDAEKASWVKAWHRFVPIKVSPGDGNDRKELVRRLGQGILRSDLVSPSKVTSLIKKNFPTKAAVKLNSPARYRSRGRRYIPSDSEEDEASNESAEPAESAAEPAESVAGPVQGPAEGPEELDESTDLDELPTEPTNNLLHYTEYQEGEKSPERADSPEEQFGTPRAQENADEFAERLAKEFKREPISFRKPNSEGYLQANEARRRGFTKDLEKSEQLLSGFQSKYRKSELREKLEKELKEAQKLTEESATKALKRDLIQDFDELKEEFEDLENTFGKFGEDDGELKRIENLSEFAEELTKQDLKEMSGIEEAETVEDNHEITEAMEISAEADEAGANTSTAAGGDGPPDDDENSTEDDQQPNKEGIFPLEVVPAGTDPKIPRTSYRYSMPIWKVSADRMTESLDLITYITAIEELKNRGVPEAYLIYESLNRSGREVLFTELPPQEKIEISSFVQYLQDCFGIPEQMRRPIVAKMRQEPTEAMSSLLNRIRVAVLWMYNKADSSLDAIDGDTILRNDCTYYFLQALRCDRTRKQLKMMSGNIKLKELASTARAISLAFQEEADISTKLSAMAIRQNEVRFRDDKNERGDRTPRYRSTSRNRYERRSRSQDRGRSPRRDLSHSRERQQCCCCCDKCSKQDANKQRKCFKCNRRGHMAKDCRNGKNNKK